MTNELTTRVKPNAQAAPKSAGEGKAIPFTAESSEPVMRTAAHVERSAGWIGDAISEPPASNSAQITGEPQGQREPMRKVQRD